MNAEDHKNFLEQTQLPPSVPFFTISSHLGPGAVDSLTEVGAGREWLMCLSLVRVDSEQLI